MTPCSPGTCDFAFHCAKCGTCTNIPRVAGTALCARCRERNPGALTQAIIDGDLHRDDYNPREKWDTCEGCGFRRNWIRPWGIGRTCCPCCQELLRDGDYGMCKCDLMEMSPGAWCSHERDRGGRCVMVCLEDRHTALNALGFRPADYGVCATCTYLLDPKPGVVSRRKKYCGFCISKRLGLGPVPWHRVEQTQRASARAFLTNTTARHH